MTFAQEFHVRVAASWSKRELDSLLQALHHHVTYIRVICEIRKELLSLSILFAHIYFCRDVCDLLLHVLSQNMHQ